MIISYRPSLTNVLSAFSETQLDYNQIFLQTYGFDEDIMKVISALTSLIFDFRCQEGEMS